MEEQLIIEGIRFDLGKRTISHTLQVNDLADLKDRRANVSNTIRAPYTPNNIAALNFLGIAGSQSRAPYRKLHAKHIIDGIEVVSNGYAKIIAVDDVIEIVVYSGNIDLIERLESRNITDLDFSDLNHFLNLTTFEDGMDNDSGYIYALADFGIEPPRTTGLMQSEWQLPSLFVSNIFEKIFTGIGATYSGDVFEDESFLTEVVSPAKGFEVEEVSETQINKGYFSTNEITVVETSNSRQEYIQRFNLTPHGLIDITLLDGQFARVDFDGILKIIVETAYYVNHGVLRIDVKKNESTIKTEVLTEGSGSETTEIHLSVKAGDVFSFYVRGTSEQTDPNLPIFKCEFGANLVVDFIEIKGGLWVDFNEIMPEISQTEFVKDIMQRYGLVFRSRGNHYEFKRLENILNDRENAEDWSDKLKIEQGENYEFGDFARNNVLRYNYTEDAEGEFQDGVMIAENEHNALEKDMFTSVFTISEESGKSLSRQLYSVPVREGKYNEDTGELEEVKVKEVSARLFKIQKLPGALSVKFFDSQPLSISKEIPFLSLENIQMDFYISRYYKAFNRILNAPKVRGDLFYLNALDVQNLDFFKLKYLKQRGQYFYLDKVESFRPGQLTKCRMIQVNGISKGITHGNQPPIQLGVKTFTLRKGASVSLNLEDFIDTNPPYFDPEYDAPEQIMILSTGIAHTRMLNNGIIISDETVIDANNFNLIIQDFGTTNQAHTARFQFKIQSYNNPNFSEVTGEIVANVLEHINRAPVADAGLDIVIEQEPGTLGNSYQYERELNGCDSYDPDGDPITYDWELIDAPTGVSLSDDDICNPTLDINIPNGPDLIRFQIKLTVQDSEGLTDSDFLNVTLTTYANTNG